MLRLPITLLAAVAALLVPSVALAQDGAAVDPAALVALLSAHSWAALAAVAIPLVLHLAQADVHPLGLTLPAAWRPVVVVALGQLAGVADALAHGAAWGPALATGAAASLLALLVQPPPPPPAVAGELLTTTGDGAPQTNAAGAAPAGDRSAPTVPPIVGGLLFALGGLVLAGALVSCTAAQQATAAQLGGAALAIVDGPACDLVEVRSGSALAGVLCSAAAAALEHELAAKATPRVLAVSGDAAPVKAARCKLVPVHVGGIHEGYACEAHEAALVAALSRDGGPP